ncbi:flagellin N-terminal helical domain-containing protein [Duganella vulcania]|uniref:Flagellin n=1 Tax=Duganella vulcania TaxID=2692166 RepID=A0A845H265_9BURK|nr:flagellin [Duganella vulcania]MYM98779.1 flagellin [Duganella vulcania]
MAQVINTNIASLNSQRNLTTSQANLSTSLQRLSSGLRINSAKDDAAGLAISERFTSQIRGNTTAARNANDGISLAQTAEGGLSTAGDLLQRIRELAVQSANGSNSASDRQSIQNEVGALSKELDRVATSTQFNGQNVLDGSLTSTQFQVGANSGQTINIGVQSARASDIGNNTIKPVDTATSLSQAVTGANANLDTADAANLLTADETLTIKSGAGTTQDIFVKAPQLGATPPVNGDTAASTAAKVNAASGTTGVTAQAKTVATIAGVVDGSVNFQLRGANSIANDPNSKAVTISAKVVGGDLSALAQAVNAQTATTNVTASVKLDATGKKELQLVDSTGNNIQLSSQTGDVALQSATVRGADIGGSPSATTVSLATGGSAAVGGRVEFSSDSGFSITSTVGVITGGTTVGSDLQSVSKIDVSTVDGSNAALKTIDSALNSINSNRAALGAIQNRFASTISNLNTTTENLSASRSRIQDTDFASETANLTRGQILQQAGTAILAQANSLPNGVLSLLRG